MSALLPFLTVFGCLALVVGFLAWLAARVRGRGMAGAAIGAALAAHDEAFRVTAHDAHHEIRAQAERKAPLMSPDDHWISGRDEQPPTAGRRPLRPRTRRPRQGRAHGRWTARLRRSH
jgi:hypothetical protein